MPRLRRREQSGGNVRLVIDTNVLLSGLLWQGSPRLLFECVCNAKVDLLMSQKLMDEFAEVIRRRKFATILQRASNTPEQICHQLAQVVEMIVAPPLNEPVSRDPDDDHVLACAVAGMADLIVSGDDDLLVLESFRGIPIVATAAALQYLDCN